LNTAYSKTHGQSTTKDTIVYVSDGSAEDGFTATVTCAEFNADHSGTGPSKKAAELAAAAAALKAEFKDFYAGMKNKGNMKLKGKLTQQVGKKGKVQQTIAKADKVRKFSARADGTICFKAVLNGAFMEKHKEKLNKDALTYSQVRDEEGGYTVTLSSDEFKGTFIGKGSNPKLAGDDAAKKALKKEFPSFKYAKADFTASQPAGNKSALSNGMSVVSGKCLVKGDVEYTVAEEGGKFVATVILHCLGDKKFKGSPESDRKLAEESAATKALKQYSKQIDIKRLELEAKRAEKKAESLAKKAAA